MSVSETNFLEMSAHVLLKVAPKGYFRSKKPQNISIVINIFLKQKRGSTTKKIEVVSSIFMNITCSARYFLEVAASVLLKVATKASLRGKKL